MTILDAGLLAMSAPPMGSKQASVSASLWNCRDFLYAHHQPPASSSSEFLFSVRGACWAGWLARYARGDVGNKRVMIDGDAKRRRSGETMRMSPKAANAYGCMSLPRGVTASEWSAQRVSLPMTSNTALEINLSLQPILHVHTPAQHRIYALPPSLAACSCSRLCFCSLLADGLTVRLIDRPPCR